jgi:hypothetical protein
MAVFPYARRALWRPVRMSWLVAAAVLVATTGSVVTVALLSDSAPRAETPAFVSEASSTTLETSSAMGFSAAGQASPAWYTEAQAEALITGLANLIAAAKEAQHLTSLQVAAAVEGEARAASERVAEVSEAPVLVVVEPTPEISGATAEPATVAPVNASAVTEAPPAEQAAPPAPPPVQPVVNAPAGPVERWAAAGIVIVTQRQALDEVSLANVDAALSALPASVLGSLGNPAMGPLHILVNTEGRVLSGDQPYGGPANFFSTNEGKNELVLYPQQSVFTIVHELGHAYNLRRIAAGRYAMVLLDVEMRSFLNATGWQIASNDEQIRGAVDHMHVSYTYTGSFHWPRLSNDDPLEDFANSFSMYFLDPAGLNASSPERYAWMAATFGN